MRLALITLVLSFIIMVLNVVLPKVLQRCTSKSYGLRWTPTPLRTKSATQLLLCADGFPNIADAVGMGVSCHIFLAALSSSISLVVCPSVGPSVGPSLSDVCEKVTFTLSKGN